MRKIIQISQSTTSYLALCDDGTLWAYCSDAQWKQVTAIPQDPEFDSFEEYQVPILCTDEVTHLVTASEIGNAILQLPIHHQKILFNSFNNRVIAGPMDIAGRRPAPLPPSGSGKGGR